MLGRAVAEVKDWLVWLREARRIGRELRDLPAMSNEQIDAVLSGRRREHAAELEQ